MSICLFVTIYVFLYVWMCVCVCVYLWVCMHVCVSLWFCVLCVCLFVGVCLGVVCVDVSWDHLVIVLTNTMHSSLFLLFFVKRTLSLSERLVRLTKTDLINQMVPMRSKSGEKTEIFK